MKIKISRAKRIMLGFLAVIFFGAGLLMLPWATKEGETTTFINALFTSVSATCVTGLVAYDTWSHWTLFGQIILLIQIQIGGLGFITISTFAMIMLKRKIGLDRRALIQDSLNTLQIKGSVTLVRGIVLATLMFEGIGAILLSTVFIPEVGVAKGIWYSIFHAVSAFCNAGFDLMGWKGEFASLSSYYDNALFIFTISALVIIGGLGFLVWEDLYHNKHHWKKYSLQTKMVIAMTSALLLGGTVLFLVFERNNLFVDMTLKQKLLAAFFSAVTPRTAGFNSIDTAALSSGSIVLTIVFMFIGGSPGSTAGGIKTTTFFIMILQLNAYLMNEKESVIFKKRMDDDVLKKATTIVVLNLALVIIGLFAILACQNLPFVDIVFEVFSAIGTVGMSTGITRSLGFIPRIVIMVLMYAGRMGSLTIAMSFTERNRTNKISYPKGSITVG